MARSDDNSNPQDTHREAREAAAAGASLFSQARYSEAVAQLQRAVRLWPTHPDLHYNLALAAWGVNDLRTVRSHLLQTLDLDPRYALAYDALARLHLQAREVAAADQFTAAAVRLSPTNPELLFTRATVLDAQERWLEAWNIIEPALGTPALADRIASLRARLAPKLHRESEAVATVAAALAMPAGEARFRRQLHFAAAALFDWMERYSEAFEQARLGHETLRPPYNPTERRSEFERRIAHWTADRIRLLSRATHGSRRPVFMVGMPRSGTSLVEQILSCHGRVFGAGELGALGRAAATLDATGLPYPRSLESLSPAAANHIGAAYLAEIAALDSRADYVTDKMPLNLMYLDLVEVLLPQSRVIHCTRDPLDTCLSCYLTDFAIPYDFAGDQRSLGEFYRLYQRLMEHWRRVLSLPILEVRYEDVVNDLEGQTRRLLEFLNLPWDPSCLRFHENPRPVETASREQVRQPVYASSIGRWKHYQSHLGELIDALGR
jgi:tetratricopeptide (TPR) repeat protein